MTGETVIRLVVVDDHDLFRECLKEKLERTGSFRVVGEAAEARGAYDIVGSTLCDVVLLDLGLPGASGGTVLRELVRRNPKLRILVLTTHGEVDFVADALTAGATGYALKYQTADEIMIAIRAVHEGRRYLAPSLPDESIVALSTVRKGKTTPLGVLGHLSPREREVFDMLIRGYGNAGVAQELSISVKTVESHREHILRKLQVHSIVDLVRLAARHRLISDAV